mgnify:CR=1 FL=1
MPVSYTPAVDISGMAPLFDVLIAVQENNLETVEKRLMLRQLAEIIQPRQFIVATSTGEVREEDPTEGVIRLGELMIATLALNEALVAARDIIEFVNGYNNKGWKEVQKAIAERLTDIAAKQKAAALEFQRLRPGTDYETDVALCTNADKALTLCTVAQIAGAEFQHECTRVMRMVKKGKKARQRKRQQSLSV